MSIKREYPDRPVVGVGGVVIESGQALLVRRALEPLKGQWSIPGGALEVGETLVCGVARELEEETGLVVRVGQLIEVFERIFFAPGPSVPTPAGGATVRPQYHFIILDYLCERAGGELRASSDVTDAVFAREEELPQYHLTETAARILRRAFTMARAPS